jgi:hypothetical protein
MFCCALRRCSPKSRLRAAALNICPTRITRSLYRLTVRCPTLTRGDLERIATADTMYIPVLVTWFASFYYNPFNFRSAHTFKTSKWAVSIESVKSLIHLTNLNLKRHSHHFKTCLDIWLLSRRLKVKYDIYLYIRNIWNLTACIDLPGFTKPNMILMIC